MSVSMPGAAQGKTKIVAEQEQKSSASSQSGQNLTQTEPGVAQQEPEENTSASDEKKDKQEAGQNTSAPDKQKEKKDETQTVELVAVGDNLIHRGLYLTCKTKKGYNFNPVYKHVKKDIKAADLAVINQETILVKKHYSGYPCFGSPRKVADAVAAAGFDIVTHATNHTMDRGTAAITGTLSYWTKKHPKIKVLGIHKSKKQASKITVVKKNGIRIAMLNYTYGLNGFKLPSGRGYLVDLLTESRKKKIKKDIRRAKKKSDFVIVFAHWGTEYQYKPDAFQKRWAKFFARQGVDLLIGAHPHVVEPMRTVKGKKGHKMVCYYSLGNFVSAQDHVPCMLGGMAKVKIVKDKKGVHIKSKKLIPLVTHLGKKGRPTTVYKLSDYTEKLAKKNRIRRVAPGEKFSKKRLKSLFKKITK